MSLTPPGLNVCWRLPGNAIGQGHNLILKLSSFKANNMKRLGAGSCVLKDPQPKTDLKGNRVWMQKRGSASMRMTFPHFWRDLRRNTSLLIDDSNKGFQAEILPISHESHFLDFFGSPRPCHCLWTVWRSPLPWWCRPGTSVRTGWGSKKWCGCNPFPPRKLTMLCCSTKPSLDRYHLPFLVVGVVSKNHGMFCCANAKDHQIPSTKVAMCMKVHGKLLERDVKSQIPRQE